MKSYLKVSIGKSAPLIFCFLLWTASSQAQTVCDSLIIDEIRYTAFNDTMLQVMLTNFSSDIFPYPGLVLLDMNGDTLAVETVNFFGIANQSVHLLTIHPSANLQGPAPISATLDLWTGFYQNFECSFPVSFDLCPTTACNPVLLTIANTGGALVTAQIDWSLIDSLGMALFSGTFNLNATMQQISSDTVCLSPGSFTLSVESPLTTGGQLFYSIHDLGGSGSPALSSNYVQGAPTNDLSFVHFGACLSQTNNIVDEIGNDELLLDFQQGDLLIQVADDVMIGYIQVYDSQGRIFKASTASRGSQRLAMGSHPGVLFLELELNGKRVQRKFFCAE